MLKESLGYSSGLHALLGFKTVDKRERGRIERVSREVERAIYIYRERERERERER